MKILKSLICIFLCLLGIMGCLVYDQDNRERFEQAKQIKEREITSKEGSASAIGQEKKNSVQIDKNKMAVTVVTGTNGDLDAGGAETIYEYPIDSSEEIAYLQYNCCVLLKEENVTEGWNSVWVNDDTIGYVKSSGSEVDTIYVGSKEKARDAVLKDAYSFLGIPFERYGTSLESGIDCSNYIAQVYARNGYDIPDVPNDMRDQGTPVSEEDAEPGDIVYYNCNGGNGHVGIYFGEDENGEKYVINTAGHAGQTYPEGGCRINRIQYNDRTKYHFYSFLS